MNAETLLLVRAQIGLPMLAPIRRCREIRIEHRVGSMTGGGCWAPDTPATRAILQSHVDDQAARWGPGTHWIAERDA